MTDEERTTSGDEQSPDRRLDDLARAIAALASPEEAADFLRDLCTAQELDALSVRWLVARRLDQGWHYSDVAQETGASRATISRVNTWLRYGRGGYAAMLARWRERGW
ncbi:MAG: YerC/YecD family TrpR-related protein [Candidatus Dormiibacterota bacterium]